LVKRALSNPAYAAIQGVGRNQSSLVAAATTAISRHGVDILQSQGLRIGSQVFCFDAIVCGDSQSLSYLARDLKSQDRFNLRLVAIPAIETETRPPMHRFEVNVYCFNHVGVLARVTSVLAAEGLDVEQLHASQYPAPFTGTEMFCIAVTVDAPDPESARRAKANLLELAALERWDLYFDPVLSTNLRINPLAAYPPGKCSVVVKSPNPPRS
jgi:glycine cleavage system regulatory protein